VVSISLSLSRRGIICGLAAIALVAAAATASLLAGIATAQTPPGGGDRPRGAGEVLTTLSCFESLRVVGRTQETRFSATSTTFQNIPGAGLNMVVPAGSDCLIATFSAEISATPNTGCEVQALLGGSSMRPTDARTALVAASGNVTFVWAQTVSVASQTTFLIQIQAQVLGGAGSECAIDDWTLLVERRN
jgi:hypothetical protein